MEALLGDNGEIASTYYPPLLPYFDKSIKPYPHHLEKAKHMLDDISAELVTPSKLPL